MLALAWVISLVAVFMLGYKLNRLEQMVKKIRVKVKKKADKPPEKKPESVIIDPLDPIQQAKMNREDLIRRINDGEYDDLQ